MKNNYIYIAIIVLLVLDVIITHLKKWEKQDKTDYSTAYQKRLLLTKNEWKNCMFLKPILEGEGMRICPKVRLLDLVEPKKGTDGKQRQTLLNKIQSKHVDFVICDEKLNVLLILELDDSSHDTETRKQRDTFVDSVLTGSGYRILHVRSFEDELGAILATLKEVCPKNLQFSSWP